MLTYYLRYVPKEIAQVYWKKLAELAFLKKLPYRAHGGKTGKRTWDLPREYETCAWSTKLDYPDNEDPAYQQSKKS
jgi:hypothetical protein